MTGIKRVVAVGAAVVVLTVGGGSAMARGNPTGKDNPYASVTSAPGCVYTYQAPPADGEEPRGKGSKGGDPGFVSEGSRGPDC